MYREEGMVWRSDCNLMLSNSSLARFSLSLLLHGLWLTSPPLTHLHLYAFMHSVAFPPSPLPFHHIPCA